MDGPAAAAVELPAEHDVISIRNIFARVDLGCRIDLKRVAQNARNAEYHPKRFPAAVMRIKGPRCTASIYASGKMTTMGTHSEADARLASRKFARILQKLGYDARHDGFEIKNVLGVVQTEGMVDLFKLAREHCNFATFEPELFPGLIYRVVKPKVTMFIFTNGKLVLTGARCREHIYEAFEQMQPVIRSYRMHRRPFVGTSE